MQRSFHALLLSFLTLGLLGCSGGSPQRNQAQSRRLGRQAEHAIAAAGCNAIAATDRCGTFSVGFAERQERRHFGSGQGNDRAAATGDANSSADGRKLIVGSAFGRHSIAANGNGGNGNGLQRRLRISSRASRPPRAAFG